MIEWRVRKTIGGTGWVVVTGSDALYLGKDGGVRERFSSDYAIFDTREEAEQALLVAKITGVIV